jgi:hypothetical protein
MVILQQSAGKKLTLGKPTNLFWTVFKYVWKCELTVGKCPQLVVTNCEIKLTVEEGLRGLSLMVISSTAHTQGGSHLIQAGMADC